MKNITVVLIMLFAASVLAVNSYAGDGNTPVITNPSGGGSEKPKPDNDNSKGDKGSPEKGKDKRRY